MSAGQTDDTIDTPLDVALDDDVRATVELRRPLPTASLARLYEEQGLVPLAVETWRRVLAASPGDVDALAALSSFGEVVVDDGTAPTVVSEPSVELPVGYGIDEVIALAVDGSTLLVCWEMTAVGVDRARMAGGDGPATLRVVSTWLDASGAPTQETHDIVLPAETGELLVEGLPDGATHVCAVGLSARLLRAAFAPVAHSEPVATPRA